MKKTKPWMLVGILSLLVLFGNNGCKTVVQGTPKPALSVEASEQSVQLGDRLLRAIMEDNFAEFNACIGNDSEIKTEDDFAQSQSVVRKQFGNITKFEYVTSLKMPVVQNMVWKVTFVRKGTQDNDIEQQLLFRLLIGEVDGRRQVLGMGFI